MTTYILRHGLTDFSKQYVVNGDPARPVQLNDEGVRLCHRQRSVLPFHRVRTWLVSEFPRVQQSASLLMGALTPELIVDARLNELDYGRFESGPFLEYGTWLARHGGSQRPPAARESQREGIRRMLTGVQAALEHPEPRVLVCHGLLVSVLLWHRDRSPDEAMPLFFPEAPYVDPLAVGDEAQNDWIVTLLGELDAEEPQDPDARGAAAESRTGGCSVVATFRAVVHSPEKKEPPHA
ncbi:histidine phosphatase family protein [Streptomyces rishiriensis]|uniref:histidine phosphatase family protein n=1 Tax=Streptomyces rishiriensis TaxID=68264 RepID=UPI0037CD67DB